MKRGGVGVEVCWGGRSKGHSGFDGEAVVKVLASLVVRVVVGLVGAGVLGV